MEVLFPCYGGVLWLFFFARMSRDFGIFMPKQLAGYLLLNSLLYISYFFTNSARIAFTTAMTITPTSAKIAIHILAMPVPQAADRSV